MTSERKPYPSFAPEDFPAAYKASQAALQNAQLKAIQRNDQQVSKTIQLTADHQAESEHSNTNAAISSGNIGKREAPSLKGSSAYDNDCCDTVHACNAVPACLGWHSIIECHLLIACPLP